MNEEFTNRMLVIVEVTGARPDRPTYHAQVQVLNSRVAADAERAGWAVNRVAAADVTPADLLCITADADALVIVGGEDVTPHFYGGTSGYEGETQHFATADEGQIALVQRALALGTPLLGICRGLQIINVALGGNLVQHIDDGIHKNIDVPIDQILSTHEVSLSAGSTLAVSLGRVDISVQSAHHQIVDRLGAGLVAAAHASDGLIEALEHESAPITGVQWHPEAPDSPADQLALLLFGLATQHEARIRSERRVAATALVA
ncbi:MAG: gamma-glutamyl-gamma-aminobutyrate hydrolase family protein [Cryobacterium sp.]|uniref:gamma-glutamyl-gamma-aminobutyrate hydrolase family protein n=1 Tax=unclassified Cryobacterium TaxID=2649013 RepID=UPI0018CB9277|nr:MULTISPECIES: gamma-glutamyl-gamma-aminobutyrate hydrolase family protein [unclassified Cryobacterium]MCY7404294.1 gamma-glutamyl-gamma-aminobutyrate hydrolase family protein [Cryobacterium sp.]MEC5153171.1 putative glutamine amidotransferase [Cryobacterium sp. CAN_C3]